MLLATQPPDTLGDVRPEEGFIAREFLLPSIRDRVLQGGILPEEVELCLLDLRLIMTYRYEEVIRSNKEPFEILQHHYNTIDLPGGYRKEHCLYITPSRGFTGFTRPVVRFSASNYIYAVITDPNNIKNKLKCLAEINLDF